jgi:hypothetical protein
MRRNRYSLFFFIITGLCLTVAVPSWSQTAESAGGADAASSSQKVNAPDVENLGTISGTVEDAYGDVVPGATVVLESSSDRKTMAADDNGFFHFNGLTPGTTYKATISANGFDSWVSIPVILTPGQFFEITGIHIKLQDAVTSVTVTADPVEIATEQVQIAEKQRVLGFVPNFYVIYDSKDAVPLTSKLKYQMAMKVAIDPVSVVGAMALAGMNQAGNRPDYPQGWGGYAQRFGAAYADGVTDIMFGGAILPSLLHQDPRYFYQGTGSVGSRMRHALANPFICKSDSGHLQPNYSSLGGDLISSGLSNLYYPASNRGAGFVFTSFALSTGTREMSSLLQEFVMRKLTPSARKRE